MPNDVSDIDEARVSGWTVELPDGREFVWSGFYTGPRELTKSEVTDAAQVLLDLKPDELARAAETLIRPALGDDGTGPAIVLHSATPVLMTLAGDLDSVRYGRLPEDVATFIETRAVALARPGDLVVGRTAPWQVAAEAAGVEALNVPGLDFYYLSHAIIQLLLDYGTSSSMIQRMIAALRLRPETVVRLYCLDVEAQIILLYLRRAAGIQHIYTDANSPQVGGRWNTKAPLHPTIGDAAGIEPGGLDATELLTAETRLTPWHRELAIEYERLPGYAFDTGSGGIEQVARDLVAAARLLRQRYGVEVACLKPSAGAGGNRIITALPLAQEDELRRLADILWRSQESYVLEAQVDYLPVRIGRADLRLNLSAHVRFGRVAEGLTLQLTKGTAWQGNLYLDGTAWAALGLAGRHYDRVLGTVENLRSALAAQGQLLVTGGVDFAIGRVGGRFGDRVFVAPQDPNLSSHGAEFLRRYRGHLDGRFTSAVTKVVCPTAAGCLPVLEEMAGPVPGGSRAVLCSVPGHWGMIAAAANSPAQALDQVVSFEEGLIRAGLAVTPNH